MTCGAPRKNAILTKTFRSGGVQKKSGELDPHRSVHNDSVDSVVHTRLVLDRNLVVLQLQEDIVVCIPDISLGNSLKHDA